MSAGAIRLEFAPRARSISRLGLALLACGIVLLAAELWQLGSALRLRQQESSRLADLEARRSERAAARIPRPVKADPAEVARMRSAQKVAMGLATPWSDLLESLESAPQDAVALMAVEPSASKRSLRITAEAKDVGSMLGYVEALQHDPRLGSVVLASHQVQLQVPGTPIRFQVQALWGERR